MQWNCGWVLRIYSTVSRTLSCIRESKHRSIMHVRPRLTITNSEPMLPADKKGLRVNLLCRKYTFIRKVNDNCLCSPQTLIYLQPGSFQEGFVYRNMLNAEFAFAAYGGSPPNRQIFLFRAESASALYGIPREMMGHFPRDAHTVRRHSQPAA